jgi:hypothetical protein
MQNQESHTRPSNIDQIHPDEEQSIKTPGSKLTVPNASALSSPNVTLRRPRGRPPKKRRSASFVVEKGFSSTDMAVDQTAPFPGQPNDEDKPTILPVRKNGSTNVDVARGNAPDSGKSSGKKRGRPRKSVNPLQTIEPSPSNVDDPLPKIKRSRTLTFSSGQGRATRSATARAASEVDAAMPKVHGH